MSDSRIDDILKRLTRLEMLERNRGDLFLFLVETGDEHEYLVCARTFDSCKVLLPTQQTITYIGVAGRMYKQEQIIRILR